MRLSHSALAKHICKLSLQLRWRVADMVINLEPVASWDGLRVEAVTTVGKLRRSVANRCKMTVLFGPPTGPWQARSGGHRAYNDFGNTATNSIFFLPFPTPPTPQRLDASLHHLVSYSYWRG